MRPLSSKHGNPANGFCSCVSRPFARHGHAQRSRRLSTRIAVARAQPQRSCCTCCSRWANLSENRQRKGFISDINLTRLDESLTEYTTILGGCERIKNTPLPPSYTFLAHRVVLAYCLIVPFGLIAELRYFTPLLSLVVAFAFLTLDRISELIEQPFSTDINDLPLSGLSNTIENDVRERTDRDLIPKLEPEDGVLL